MLEGLDDRDAVLRGQALGGFEEVEPRGGTDPALYRTSRAAAFKYLRARFNEGEIITGLLYIDKEREEMHDLMGNVDEPLSTLSLEKLHPGSAGLKKILANYR